jgi:hypothetical protein
VVTISLISGHEFGHQKYDSPAKRGLELAFFGKIGTILIELIVVRR